MKRCLALCGVLLAGCTSEASLSYTPPPPALGLFAPAPVIATIAVTDQRPEAPRRLATIMNMYGMPSQILDTRLPVKDEVGAVFDQALLVRHLTRNDGSGPLALTLVIHKFDSDMILGGQANIDLDLALIDRASGRIVHGDHAQKRLETSNRAALNFLFGPAATPITTLQRMCEQVLDQATDELLEKPGFHQAVMQAAATPAPGF